MTIAPDAKDWTWVLHRPCPECGFEATSTRRENLGADLRENARGFVAVLGGPDVAQRPDPTTWSPLEYGCHVRDVHRVFVDRVRLMLDRETPTFASWDQDATALEDRYDEQDPATVARELIEAADQVADVYDAVAEDGWQRRGLRGNGSEFTVGTLGLYHLHDAVHHAHDVRRAAGRATVAAYDAWAAQYRDGVAMSERARARLEELAAELAPGARVLEIGSGPGRDAAALEDLGLSVRRTDVSAAFVDLLRADGVAADVLDPLVDDLCDPLRPGTPYDAVWASATLLHVARPDLPTVLARLAAVTRPGGVLHVSLKEGDGERWSTHGQVAAPRRFVLWREEPLRGELARAGWSVAGVNRWPGLRDDRWLDVLARRA